MIDETSAFEPRGTIRSISPWRGAAATSSRDATSEIASGGMTPPADSAPCIAATSAAFVCAASLPPLRMTAFADLSASALICTAASGRDSKITQSTPIGHGTRPAEPASCSVARCTTPTGSASARTSSTLRIPSNFAPSTSSRLSSGASDASLRLLFVHFVRRLDDRARALEVVDQAHERCLARRGVERRHRARRAAGAGDERGQIV